MNSGDNDDPPDTSRSVGALVDEACDVFEAAWQHGERPRIEDYLDRVDPSKRETLLSELLLLDLSYRRRHGERPQQREYVERFPDDDELIRRLFNRLDATATPDATPPFEPRAGEIGQSVSMSTRYSRLKFHDEGGLGEVFAAHDEELGREVALKFVRQQHAGSEELVSRFHLEAEVTSRLDHPGVVPVYGTGESWDGRPCYAMRFIEGVNLRTTIQKFHETDWRTRGRGAWRLELHRLLGHLVAACDTVAYAHNRGVLHRDIKPENIMLGRYGETLVVDWGLAQFIQRDAQAKASGEKTLIPGMTGDDSHTSSSRAGTIGYMSPEQLPDSLEPVTKACDIYSLGATLYKLLTGQTAFQRSQGRQVWDYVRRGEFRRPREVHKACPAALEAICLKAMALRPQDRYASASDFAQDLRHWMADEPVAVYREPLFEQLARIARRHRAWTMAVLTIAALVLTTTFLGMALFGALATREHELRTQAETAERIAEDARQANLRSTAAFAANTYGYEIDQRWRILSELAAEAELHTLIKDASGKPTDSAEQARLQNWLMVHSSELLPDGKADSWFINDATGIQLARNPWKSSIGQSYRHRSYFHGGERDVSAEEAEMLSPTTQPNLSAVYESTATHELKVSFTVPIWDSQTDEDAGPLGVLGMSVKLGDFVQLEAELENMSVVLVDLGTDWLEGEPKTGLVLDHPNLDAARLARAARTGHSLLRLDTDQVELLGQLRSLRRQQRSWRGESARRPDFGGLSRTFEDPVAEPPAATCVAAFEPVFVPGREETLADTGWVVIIEDHANAVETAPSPASP
jgi:serine/threonine-protein kinase